VVGTPPDPSVAPVDDWEDATGVSSGHSGSIQPDACSGDSWLLQGFRVDMHWRWALADPDSIYAIPEIWRDMFTDGVMNHARLLGIRSIVEQLTSVETVETIEESSACLDQDGYWNTEGGYLKFSNFTSEESLTCEIIGASGVLHTQTIGESVFAIGRDIIGNSCMSGAQRDESITPLLGDDTAFMEIPWKT
jgi:hypothetical protein